MFDIPMGAYKGTCIYLSCPEEERSLTENTLVVVRIS